jgi:uncharacterized cupin superfamily protein
MNVIHNIADITWPEPVELAADRVTSGSPTASTLTLHSTKAAEFGLWYSTPGAFTTNHEGYEEYFHVIEGEGELVRDDGWRIPLIAGTIVYLEAGWRGRWVIRKTIIKSYTTVAGV